MSNRFHNKWHRVNHHTYGSINNPDCGHDPIASQKQPFHGEFVLSGALSAYAPLSAYAGHFYCNNTAICAIAYKQGLFVTAFEDGMQIFSENLAISAYSWKLGMSVASQTRAISAKAGFLGLDIYSGNRSISAFGKDIGIDVYSDHRAISAYGYDIAGEFYSNNRAISAFGDKIGLNVYSNNRAISAFGDKIGIDVTSNNRAISAFGNSIGLDIYSNNRAISAFGDKIGIDVTSNNRAISAFGDKIGLDIYSNNRAISAFGDKIGIDVTSNNRAISAFGNSIGLDIYSNNRAISAFGDKIGLDIYSNNRAISAFGDKIGLDIYSNNRAISAFGAQIAGEFYSLNIPLSTAYGKNILHGQVGINTNNITTGKVLDLVGDSNFQGNVNITLDLNVDGGDLTSANPTFNLLNGPSAPTTINFGGVATNIEIAKPDSTSTVNINSTKDSTSITTGALVVDGGVGIAKNVNIGLDLAVNGGDITTTATTATIFSSNVTTLNFATAGTLINIGSATGTTAIKNNLDVTGEIFSGGDVTVEGGDIKTFATTTATVFNTVVTTLSIGGAATTVGIGASTGTTTINNGLVVTGGIGAGSGTTTVNNALVVTGGIGAATGTTTVNNSLSVAGTSGITATNGFNDTSVEIIATNTLAATTITKRNTYYTGTANTAFAVTLPTAAATANGAKYVIMSTAARSGVTWTSTGATFVGLPSSLTANTPICIQFYNNIWYISR